MSGTAINPKLLSKPQRHALEAIVLTGLSRHPTYWFFPRVRRAFSLATVQRLRLLGLCKVRTSGPPHCVATVRGRQVYDRLMGNRAKPVPSPTAAAHALLAFAIERIAQTTNDLADCHIDPRTARIRPASVAKEVRENYDWLRKARRAVRR